MSQLGGYWGKGWGRGLYWGGGRSVFGDVGLDCGCFAEERGGGGGVGDGAAGSRSVRSSLSGAPGTAALKPGSPPSVGCLVRQAGAEYACSEVCAATHSAHDSQ